MQQPRRSRLTYALTQTELVLPGESRAEYESFTNRLLDDILPIGREENALAQTVVDLMWRLRRAMADENNILVQYRHDTSRLVTALDNLSRHEMRISNHYRKARAALAALQRARTAR